MPKALVSCPATHETELIEFVETPLGALIHACSRFRPATSLRCSRACASGGRCDLEDAIVDFEIGQSLDDDDTALDVCPAALDFLPDPK